MLTAIAIAAAVAGTVLDALTGAPVRGAVVTNGKAATAITDGEGRFQLAGLADARIDVIVQHPSYFIFAQAAVPVGSDVEIRLRPSSIEAEAIEIVETREEDLRPMLLRQDPIVLPPQYTWGIRAFEIKGIYRVCVGKDGKVSLVAALEQAGSADPYV
ncbi:MAG: carboxypeptidase-like regulatory domain-containing protein, partial [Myxococcales bacterium]